MPQANKNHTPPKWATKWIQRWIEPDTAEYLLGDLEEFFADDLEQVGPFRAKWNYSMGAIGLTRLAFLRKKQSQFFIPTGMYKNYFKIAWRNIVKQKMYSVINISGLAVGLAVFLIVLVYVKDEFSYNEFHTNKDNLYQVTTTFKNGNHWSVPSWPAGPVLKADYPDILDACRYYNYGDMLIQNGDKIVKQGDFILAEPQFLTMFDFPLLEGNREEALSNPNSLLLTASSAKVIFGNEPAMGKSVMLKIDTADVPFIVTGILKDVPKQSDIYFEGLAHFEHVKRVVSGYEHWENFGPMTFVQLHPEVKEAYVEGKITDLLTEKSESEKGRMNLHLNPLSNMHLYYLDGDGGPITSIFILGAIAIFILLIACINFMNLTTARSMIRAKEIGLRKVVGAKREHLIIQFFGESVMMSIIAMVVAVVLVYGSLPYFNELAEKELVFQPYTFPLLGYILIIALLTGLLAGSYPALLLSSYNPVAVLKGSFKFSDKGKLLRKGLVVVQFSLSIILIISTLILQKQMNFIQNKKLGFEMDQVIYIENIGNLKTKYPLISKEFKKQPGIRNVTRCSSLPSRIGSHCGIPAYEGRDMEKEYPFLFCMVDSGFAETFQMNMVEGEFFSPKHGVQTGEHPPSFVLNETAVRLMELENPVGKQISVWGGDGPVVGVIEDFHFQSMKEEVKALVLWNWDGFFSHIGLRVSPENLAETLTGIESIWKIHMPGIPFEYHFMDESFANLYTEERTISKLFSGFAILAIFISCLGLFGLAAFIAEQRKKEIGIRKVLGANISQIFSLLSKDFTYPVIVAFAIATPIGLFLMNEWIQEYQYHTTIGIWPVIIAGIAALAIAAITVSYQSIRAAWANPVDSLKDE